MAALAAAKAAERARGRRAAELARLDAAVGEADGAVDLALAVLASLLPVDVAAQLAGASAARVRQAQQRAPQDEVARRAGVVVEAQPVGRRVGRPRGGGRPAGGGLGSGLGAQVVSAQKDDDRKEDGGDDGG